MRFLSDDQIVDTPSGHRLKVLAAGLPRCATSCLEAAFEEELGLGPCMHMAHIAPYTDRLNLVSSALGERDKEKRQKILNKIFDGYVSSTDAPGCFSVEDLIEMYPDVKVVLNKRSSAQVWERSIKNTPEFYNTKTYFWATCLIPKNYHHHLLHRSIPTYLRIVQGYRDDGDDFYKADYYNFFNALVPDICRRKGVKMIEFEPNMGWEPLCNLLEKPIPSNSFPHRNGEATLKALTRFIVARAIMAWAALGCRAVVLYKYVPWVRLFYSRN